MSDDDIRVFVAHSRMAHGSPRAGPEALKDVLQVSIGIVEQRPEAGQQVADDLPVALDALPSPFSRLRGLVVQRSAISWFCMTMKAAGCTRRRSAPEGVATSTYTPVAAPDAGGDARGPHHRGLPHQAICVICTICGLSSF
jgi:hypothetical protein